MTYENLVSRASWTRYFWYFALESELPLGRTRTRTVPGVLSQVLGSQILITKKYLILIFRNGIKRRSLRLDFRKFEILDLKTYRVDSIDNWKFHFAKLKNPWKCTGSEQAAESICFRHRRYNVNLSCSNDSRPIYRWNHFYIERGLTLLFQGAFSSESTEFK